MAELLWSLLKLLWSGEGLLLALLFYFAGAVTGRLAWQTLKALLVKVRQ